MGCDAQGHLSFLNPTESSTDKIFSRIFPSVSGRNTRGRYSLSIGRISRKIHLPRHLGMVWSSWYVSFRQVFQAQPSNFKSDSGYQIILTRFLLCKHTIPAFIRLSSLHISLTSWPHVQQMAQSKYLTFGLKSMSPPQAV